MMEWRKKEMATVTTPRAFPPIDLQTKSSIPPLENGDRLTRDEFERRYEAMPNLKKAELLEGEVHMPSPARMNQHAEPDQDLSCWLAYYKMFTPGVRGGGNGTVRLDEGNEPQPDGFLFVPSEGAHIDEDDYVCGAPDLIAEISASTVSIDLGKKFRVYQRHQVKEYVVWRVQDQEFDWFILRGEQFQRLPLQDGLYKSEVFPGLWLDPAAMIRADYPRLMDVLQQGINSPEHLAFVTRLQQKNRTKDKP